MIVLHEMRRRARYLVAPVLGVAFTGYFVYHIFEGERGLYAWRDIAQQLHTAQASLSAVQDEHTVLARRCAIEVHGNPTEPFAEPTAAYAHRGLDPRGPPHRIPPATRAV